MLQGIRRSQLIAYKDRKDSMRKLIILAASLVALAALIATPFANAATTDANGVVTVTKGDIQSAMGWNNAGWDNDLEHSPAEVATSATSSPPATATRRSTVPGGWLTLNGQIVANYPTDEYSPTRITDPQTTGTTVQHDQSPAESRQREGRRRSSTLRRSSPATRCPRLGTDGYVSAPCTRRYTVPRVDGTTVDGPRHHRAGPHTLSGVTGREGRTARPSRSPRTWPPPSDPTPHHSNQPAPQQRPRLTQPGALVVSIRNRRATTTSPERRSR